MSENRTQRPFRLEMIETGGDELDEDAEVLQTSSPRMPGACIVVYKERQGGRRDTHHIEFAWLDVVFFIIFHRILVLILLDFFSLFFFFSYGLGEIDKPCI